MGDHTLISPLIASQSDQAIVQITDRILLSGELSRLEHLQLVTAILSDYRVTDEKRSQINRVFDELQLGHLNVVDLR